MSGSAKQRRRRDKHVDKKLLMFVDFLEKEIRIMVKEENLQDFDEIVNGMREVVSVRKSTKGL